MKQEKDFIEVPFGARDSELGGFEYTIPQGFEAEIKDGKVIVRKTESEDERIRKWIKKELESKYVVDNIVNNEMADKALAWLEKCAPQTHNDVGQYIKLNSEQYSFMIPSDLYPRLDGYKQQLWRKEIEYAYSNGRKDERKECEQKLAWSEEDETTKNNISHIIRQYDKIRKGENQPCWYVDDCLLWMQNIKDRVQPQSNWEPSDEDMEFLQKICRTK